MSELDNFKRKEIEAFRDKLKSTGKISQSMVTGLEDVIGFNPITSVKRIQHFTGMESAYGCNEVIDILNNLLDSEPGIESINASIYNNVDTMLGTVISLLTFMLPKAYKKYRNIFNLHDKFFKVPLDTPYFSNSEDFRGIKLGNLTGPEFISVLNSMTLREDGLRNAFKDEYVNKLEVFKDIITICNEKIDTSIITSPDTDDRELARNIIKLAYETIKGPESLVKIPGYTSTSVHFNLYTINDLLSESSYVLNLLRAGRDACVAARKLYRNEELYSNMSLSYLISSVLRPHDDIKGNKDTYPTDRYNRREFIRLNTKSLSNLIKIRDNNVVNKPEDIHNNRYASDQTEDSPKIVLGFLDSLFNLISTNDAYTKTSMLRHSVTDQSSPGWKTVSPLSSISSTENKDDSYILEDYLNLLTAL